MTAFQGIDLELHGVIFQRCCRNQFPAGRIPTTAYTVMAMHSCAVRFHVITFVRNNPRRVILVGIGIDQFCTHQALDVWRSLIDTQPFRERVGGAVAGGIAHVGADSIVTVFETHAGHFRPSAVHGIPVLDPYGIACVVNLRGIAQVDKVPGDGHGNTVATA